MISHPLIRGCFSSVCRALPLFLLYFACAPASAGILKAERYELDFTRAETQNKVRWLDANGKVADGLKVGPEGTGWDGDARTFRDLSIQTTEVIPVSLSWRTVASLSIRAEVEYGSSPAGERPYHGSLYVRFSPDAKHWSNWQVIESQKSESESLLKFEGSLAVPRQARRTYEELLREYRKRDVPWVDDEDAAAKWIVANDPDFFEKSQPFIGYVQFLYETSLEETARIKTMTFDCYFVVGGLHAHPRDDAWDIYKSRMKMDALWSFKAP